MRTIQLTQGKAALVDDADFQWLSRWKWHAKRADSVIDNWYAVRVETLEELEALKEAK